MLRVRKVMKMQPSDHRTCLSTCRKCGLAFGDHRCLSRIGGLRLRLATFTQLVINKIIVKTAKKGLF
jgi:hypothetical protein